MTTAAENLEDGRVVMPTGAAEVPVVQTPGATTTANTRTGAQAGAQAGTQTGRTTNAGNVYHPTTGYQEPTAGYAEDTPTGAGMTGETRHDTTTGYGTGEKTVANRGTRGVGSYFLVDLPLILLRVMQFAASVIVLGLLAYSINSYSFHGSRKTNYSLAVSVISLWHLLMLPLYTTLLAIIFITGIYVVAEVALMILWLVAFIVLAKTYGSFSCGSKTTTTYNPSYGSFSSFQSSGGMYDPFLGRYTTHNYGRACRSAQASIAFSGVAFILFLVSTVLVCVNVMRPAMREGGMGGMWRPLKRYGLKLNRWTGLYVEDLHGGPSDVETGTHGAGHDQHTFSTGGSTYNGTHQEKLAHQRNMSGTTNMEPHGVTGEQVTGAERNGDMAGETRM
ncbi:LAMI_0F13850g1_1 [Lachancea mirantina]|uniref:LAMI_0F13850g1_1 n=1 Tax=Lachancea mirantina TaxID=1230905 RepID=A0A1G4K3U2_9SACH|nr:LAMI_0F13850g1_1 [Lachancea mirantina]